MKERKSPPISDLLSVDAEVLQMLGKTVDELAAMTTGEFAALSYAKGIRWKVNADGGRVEGLTIVIDREQASARS
jgi:hypothetical protein